jgi:hypothetical protein
VTGAESYANLHTQLMSWSECEPLVGEYCAQAGLADTATGCVAETVRIRGKSTARVPGINQIMTQAGLVKNSRCAGHRPGAQLFLQVRTAVLNNQPGRLLLPPVSVLHPRWRPG